MRILAVSDEPAKTFYEYYTPGKLKEYDLILACGDLGPDYLEFLVTMARCPLLYVHGNHDEQNRREPEGCVCIDDMLYVYRGVRIVGLGGSYRYRDGLYMYTERKMRARIARLYWRMVRAGGFDILVTHAPARGLGDRENMSHRGFSCFVWLLRRFRPRLMVHGHVHKNYGHDVPRRQHFEDTEICNASGWCVIELPDAEP